MGDFVTQRTEVSAQPPMYTPGTVLLGKYSIKSVIGMGGFGMVLCARDRDLDRDVAIKILRADTELDEETIERFLREAQAMMRLKSPHVVRVFDAGQLDDGSPYIVMELLHGSDLGKRLARELRLPPAVAVDDPLQACDALAEVHAHDIVHRDLKPTNLFVVRMPDGSSQIKVLDFGVSKTPKGEDEMSLTSTQSMLGTPAYMAPEQMRSSRRSDARTDIWALGTVLYELVEGQLPFRGAHFAEHVVLVTTTPPEPMTYATQLAPIVMRCLEKEPAKRFANVAELASALLPFAADPGAPARVARIARTLAVPRAAGEPAAVAAAVPVPALPVARHGGRRRLVLALSAACCVAIGAIVIVAASRSDDSPAPVRTVAPVVPATAIVPPVPAPAPATAVAPPPDVEPIVERHVRPPPPPRAGSATPRVGSRSAAPAKPVPSEGSAAPPPKPPCDPYASTTGCP